MTIRRIKAVVKMEESTPCFPVRLWIHKNTGRKITTMVNANKSTVRYGLKIKKTKTKLIKRMMFRKLSWMRFISFNGREGVMTAFLLIF